MAGLAPARDIEGTVWYDSQGKVAWVEGPAAQKKPEPFVPHWVAYEQRRDRALRGGFRRHSRHGDAWPAWGGAWYGGTGFRSRVVCHPRPAFRCVRPYGGVRVIIR